MQLLLYRTVRPPRSSQRYSIGRCSFWGDLFARSAAPWAPHRRERKFHRAKCSPLKKFPKIPQTNVRPKRKKDELSFASPVLATLDQGYFPSVDRMFPCSFVRVVSRK